MAQNIKIKRIIDGKTYNTETATLVEEFCEDYPPWSSGGGLYQTRFGAFFETKWADADVDSYETINPLTPEEARAWLEKFASYQPELIEKLFGEMPEAGSGEVKYTLRMPESLKDRLTNKAKENGQSLNAWIIRCLEAAARM